MPTNEPKPPISQVIKVFRSTPLKDKSQDEYMNDKEKELALTNANIDGYYQPSLTSYIESRQAITEEGLIEIPPEVDDAGFLQLFELQHFNRSERAMLEQILLENRDAFSMHKYDIGRCNVLEMEIEITTREPKIQKYVPIAMNVQERANEILEQMETFGIIRECHETSPYVSNILVIPKKIT